MSGSVGGSAVDPATASDPVDPAVPSVAGRGARGADETPAPVAPGEARPARSLFASVVGQDGAIEALRAAARRPVHAYLVVGPAETGAVDLVRGFAAALLCPEGGCAECHTCRRALEGTHPDLVEVVHQGVSLGAEEARGVVAAAARRPLEARRQVLVVPDVDQALGVVPTLLKTVEEPPASTVVVLVAETVPPGLATLASRCARIELRSVPDEVVAAWLEGLGFAPEVAAEAARAAGGRPVRARLLAADPALSARRAAWRAVPARLDGTGATAVALAGELLGALDEAVAVLAAAQQAEAEALGTQAKAMGERAAPASKALADTHRRQQRRWRTEELRGGLGVLAADYRDQVVAARADTPGALSAARRAQAAMALVEEAARVLVRNPNEALLLQALLVRLGRPA